MGDEEEKDSLHLLTYPTLFIDTFFFPSKSKNKYLKSESRREASQNQSWCFKNVSTPFTRFNTCLK